MQRHIEREKYYEEIDFKTEVNEHGFAGQENVTYNHALCSGSLSCKTTSQDLSVEE